MKRGEQILSCSYFLHKKWKKLFTLSITVKPVLKSSLQKKPELFAFGRCLLNTGELTFKMLL